jgi:hypothetical protein
MLQLLMPMDAKICAVTQNACVTESEIDIQFSDLFERVGQLEGKVHFEIDDKVQPAQIPLRRLSIGIRDKVETEPQRLEAAASLNLLLSRRDGFQHS